MTSEKNGQNVDVPSTCLTTESLRSCLIACGIEEVFEDDQKDNNEKEEAEVSPFSIDSTE